MREGAREEMMEGGIPPGRRPMAEPMLGGARVPTTGGGARIVGDPDVAEKTQRAEDTLGPGGQGRATVMSSQGGDRVQEN